MVYGRCVGRVNLSGTVNRSGPGGLNSLDKVSFGPGLVHSILGIWVVLFGYSTLKHY